MAQACDPPATRLRPGCDPAGPGGAFYIVARPPAPPPSPPASPSPSLLLRRHHQRRLFLARFRRPPLRPLPPPSSSSLRQSASFCRPPACLFQRASVGRSSPPWPFVSVAYSPSFAQQHAPLSLAGLASAPRPPASAARLCRPHPRLRPARSPASSSATLSAARLGLDHRAPLSRSLASPERLCRPPRPLGSLARLRHH